MIASLMFKDLYGAQTAPMFNIDTLFRAPDTLYHGQSCYVIETHKVSFTSEEQIRKRDQVRDSILAIHNADYYTPQETALSKPGSRLRVTRYVIGKDDGLIHLRIRFLYANDELASENILKMNPRCVVGSAH